VAFVGSDLIGGVASLQRDSSIFTVAFGGSDLIEGVLLYSHSCFFLNKVLQDLYFTF
jgi:hypothetical protein